MISPEQVESRLSGVRDALELGRSLSSARGPSLPFTAFERRSLRICGRVAPAALQPGAQALLRPEGGLADGVCFFVSFAGSEIHVGAEFDVLVRASDRAATGTRALLVGVLPRFGAARLDSIPSGHETCCLVQFPSGIPETVRALPEGEGWNDVVAWLGTRSLLERTRG